MTVLVSIIPSSIFRHVLVTWIIRHVSRPGFSIDTQTLFYYKSSFLLQKRIENISCISCHKRPEKETSACTFSTMNQPCEKFSFFWTFRQSPSAICPEEAGFLLCAARIVSLPPEKKILLLVLSLAPRGFSPYSGFPLSSKTNISKFQFDQESGRRRTTSWMCFLQIIIYLFVYLFIYNKCYQYVNTTPAHTMRKYVLLKVNCRDVALALSQSELTKGLRNQGIAGWNGIGGNMATWNTRIN